MPPPERPSLPVPVILAIVGGGLMLLGIGLVVVMSLVVYSTVRARQSSPAPELAVHYAEVETVEAPLPARFAAALPGPGAWTAFLNDDARWPPYAHVRDRLCASDASVRERWLAAIRLHAKRGAPAERLAETYGQLGRWCGKEAHCRGVLDLLALGEAPAVRHALWQSLVSCSGPDVESRFAQDDAPPRFRLEFLRNCRYDDPPCVVDAKAEAVLADACRRDPDHTTCQEPAPAEDEPAVNWERPLSELARDGDVRLDELKQRFRDRGEELQQALASCARRSEWSWRRSDCAADLATLDWGEAKALARKIDPGDDIFALEVEATLAGFASSEQVKEHLRGLGLLGDGNTEGAVTPRAFILAAGRSYHFDTETGAFPNEHDSLARVLAERMGPELGDVVFEEVAPLEEDEDYVLHAYLNGLRHTVYPENLGDWYDVQAVVGLLNILGRELESHQRLIVLATGGQDAVVVAGPEASLASLVQQGLLVVAEAATPEDE